MAYWLTAFDGLSIPTALGDRGSMDIAAGTVSAPLITLPGGRVYDPLGTNLAYRPSAQLSAHVLLGSSSPTTLQSLLDAWQARIGVVGTLTRTGGSGNTETISARLISASVNRVVSNIHLLPVTLVFQVVAFPWVGTAHTGVALTKATVSTTVYGSLLTYGGNVPQDTITLTVTPAAGTTMTSFKAQVRLSGAGGPANPALYFTYTGTVNPTKVLTIDTGARTVVNDSVSDYAHATSPSTAEYWLEIPTAASALNYAATFTGGTGVDVSITYADAWG